MTSTAQLLEVGLGERTPRRFGGRSVEVLLISRARLFLIPGGGTAAIQLSQEKIRIGKRWVQRYCSLEHPLGLSPSSKPYETLAELV